MVSLKVIFERYKIFCLLVSLFILGGTVQSFAALSLDDNLVLGYDTEAACLKNCSSGTCLLRVATGKYTCRLLIDPIDPIETCTSGQVQYKPSGTCETTSRTCCTNGTWSGWGKECVTSYTCNSSTKPATSQSCTLSGGSSGTQTRTVTCDTSTGTWKKGSWGTCQCNKTCSGGQVFDSGTCQCCNYGCYLFKTGSSGNYYPCNCVANSYGLQTTCCTMMNGEEFQLPVAYSSCSAFASAMNLNLNNAVSNHACSISNMW